MKAIAEMLADVHLFALLDESERALLAERLDLVSANEGDVLFKRGDPGDSLYVLRSGAVELSIKNDTGDKIVLEVARAGDFFGEMSLLDGGPRQATALVTQAIDALVVDRGDLDELFRLRPATALEMLTAMGKRMRETARLLRHSATRNINDTAEDNRTSVMKAADWISEFSGSIPFLLIHCVLFFIWIILNVKPLSGSSVGGFDPYPFGLLTMAVSLEAIILSVFVLLSQNRQASRDRVRNDIEYEVNLKAELEIAHLHERVEALEASALLRLERIERLIGGAATPPVP
jgi:CRP/FNR family cyclic AMP-dependent transcriptional regulator